MTTATGKRVFTLELVKGSKPSDLVRLVHDAEFEGAEHSSDSRFGISGAFVRVLPMTDAAAIINADIKAGCGAAPLTQYVDSI